VKEFLLNRAFKISVLVSGNGSNLQALINGVNDGVLPGAKIVQVISNRKDAFGLVRGAAAKIPCFILGEEGARVINIDKNLLEILELEKPDLVVLAGYLKKINEPVLSVYRNRIINIHPSLLPKFGGPGFYGLKVHEAVLLAGEKETGATVHFVDQGLDTGRIIFQEQVAVESKDTPESLAKKVLTLEHRILVEAVRKIITSRY
jgi:phosphoribosylglycinamide formyltransferase-1